MSWIQDVLRETKDSEAPERYFYWSALAAISAVVRKNVWINRYYYKLYPNLYVFIVSERSGLRKGVPISMARSLVSEVECTKIVSGRNSIQGIVKELSLQTTLENGLVLDQAEGFLCAAEFVSFLVDDPDAMNILTDLHDTHAHLKGWKNTLKNSPIESLKSPCLTLLMASNEPLLVEGIKTKDIEGGFVARTFLIHESKKRLSNDLMDPPEIIPDYKELSRYLSSIKDVKGEFTIDPGAKSTYRTFYKDLDTYEMDKTGTIDRLGDQVLKVAMNLALARSPELVICKCDIDEAVEKSLDCLSGVRRVGMSQGKSPLAGQTKLVLDFLLRAPDNTLSRKQLLNRGRGDFDAVELDRIVDTLQQAGAIQILRDTAGFVYKMPKIVVDSFQSFIKEIQ